MEVEKILRLPVKLKMIRGEKLNLHGRRSISASCMALELECRDEDFREKKSVLFSDPRKPLAKAARKPWISDYLLGKKV